MKMMEEKSTRGSSASELDEESSFHDNSARDRSSSGSTHKEGGTREDEEQLAAKETAAVFRLRVIVLVILFLAAVAVSLGVWFITTSSEKEDFETNFDGASAKLVESFEEIADQKIGALASLSSTLTSFARNENDTWPFVVMNDFQQRAATARGLSDSLFLELLVRLGFRVSVMQGLSKFSLTSHCVTHSRSSTRRLAASGKSSASRIKGGWTMAEPTKNVLATISCGKIPRKEANAGLQKITQMAPLSERM